MARRKKSDSEDIVLEKESSSSIEKSKNKKRENASDIESESKSRANLILIALTTCIVAIIFGLFTSTSATKEVAPTLNYKFKIDVSITNSEFAAKDQPGAIKSCSGTKSFPKIVGSKIFVSDLNDKVLLTSNLPEASEIQYGKCIYEIKINDEIPGLGDQVKVWASFDFGTSEKFLVKIGNTLPHIIELKLNFS